MTGFYIPPIPHKKALGNTEQEFVKKRWFYLNKFLHSLCELEYLWASKELSIFLDDEMNVEMSLPHLPTPTEYEKSMKCKNWMDESLKFVNDRN